MSLETALNYLNEKGFGDRVRVFDVSSATVDLAAKALGTAPERIAKSLTFSLPEGPLMVICAGDRKVNNQKFKAAFSVKAKMLTREEVQTLIGHDVGGVCPFGILPGVRVVLDESLKAYDIIYPACGSDSSAVELTPEELWTLSGAAAWVDVCV